MEYIDVVVNIGTLGSGTAEAPILTVETSNQFPAVGEFVEMSVVLKKEKPKIMHTLGMLMKSIKRMNMP